MCGACVDRYGEWDGKGSRPGAELEAVLEAIGGAGVRTGRGDDALPVRRRWRGCRRTREQRRQFVAAVWRRGRAQRTEAGVGACGEFVEEAYWIIRRRGGARLTELAQKCRCAAMVRCGIAMYG